jgi:sugar O-acyltransferase (sialic acid O-acetyltransferase NeuD family)
MREKYFLFGASGHAKVILDILTLNSISVYKILDDSPKVDFLLDIPVINSKSHDLEPDQNCIISIGDNSLRKKIAFNYNFKYFKAIHATAVLSSFAEIGVGTVIMANCVLNSGCKIGNHCIINSGSVVEHDCSFDDFVHISPNAALAGNVKIGEGSHIGIGAVVIQGVKIGKWCKIGAGAVIIEDIPDYSVVVGNPGRIIKTLPS